MPRAQWLLVKLSSGSGFVGLWDTVEVVRRWFSWSRFSLSLPSCMTLTWGHRQQAVEPATLLSWAQCHGRGVCLQSERAHISRLSTAEETAQENPGCGYDVQKFWVPEGFEER